MSYGKVVVKEDNVAPIEIEIKNFIQGFFPDGKTVSIVESEVGNMVLMVDNPNLNHLSFG